MKLIWAIIRPSKRKEIEEILIEKGIKGITFEKVRGFGREGKMLMQPHELEHCKCKIIVPDEWVEWVGNTIFECCHTGSTGDGAIAVFPLDTVIDIVTGKK